MILMEETYEGFEKQEKYTEQFDMYFSGNHMEGLKGTNGGILSMCEKT